jgi:CRISPR/Cas system endoribonuclease Cas6 (RAMP superfamily)
MKIKLTISLDGKLILPLNYNHVLKDAIDKWFDDPSYGLLMGKVIGQDKTDAKKRFSFSEIKGIRKINEAENYTTFYNEFELELESYDEWFMMYLANNLAMGHWFLLAGQPVFVSDVQLLSMDAAFNH